MKNVSFSHFANCNLLEMVIKLQMSVICRTKDFIFLLLAACLVFSAKVVRFNCVFEFQNLKVTFIRAQQQ